MSEVQAPGFESDDVYNLRQEQVREALEQEVTCTFTFSQLRQIFELCYTGDIPASDVYWFCEDPVHAVKTLLNDD